MLKEIIEKIREDKDVSKRNENATNNIKVAFPGLDEKVFLKNLSEVVKKETKISVTFEINKDGDISTGDLSNQIFKYKLFKNGVYIASFNKSFIEKKNLFWFDLSWWAKSKYGDLQSLPDLEIGDFYVNENGEVTKR